MKIKFPIVALSRLWWVEFTSQGGGHLYDEDYVFAARALAGSDRHWSRWSISGQFRDSFDVDEESALAWYVREYRAQAETLLQGKDPHLLLKTSEADRFHPVNSGVPEELVRREIEDLSFILAWNLEGFLNTYFLKSPEQWPVQEGFLLDYPAHEKLSEFHATYAALVADQGKDNASIRKVLVAGAHVLFEMIAVMSEDPDTPLSRDSSDTLSLQLPPTPTEEPVPVVPNFEIKKQIGSGGFGVVFKATEKSDVAVVRAIKVLTPSPFSDSTKARDRFEREAKAINRLQHRAIARYIVSGYTEDAAKRPFMVLEYVDGEPLHKAVIEMDFPDRVAAVLEVLGGIAHAHDNDVFHRDLKPSNIMVRASDGQAVVVDFGLAYIFETLTEDLTTHYVGSQGYIPQEVLVNPQHRAPTHDIYSLGVILYETISGKRPNLQSCQPVTEVSSDLRGLDSVIQRALAEESQRYQNVMDFRGDLEKWLAQSRRTVSLPNLGGLGDKLRDGIKARQRVAEERRTAEEQKKKEEEDLWQSAYKLVYPAAVAAFQNSLIAIQDANASAAAKRCRSSRRSRSRRS